MNSYLTNLSFLSLFLIFSISWSKAAEAKKSAELLADLPRPTKENLRWMMSADSWAYKEQYLLKGIYYQISTYNKKRKKNDSFGLSVYRSVSLEGKPEITIGNRSISGKVRCTLMPVEKNSSSIACTNGACGKLTGGSIGAYRSFHSLDSKYLTSGERENCPYKIDFVNKHYKIEYGSNEIKDSMYDMLDTGTSSGDSSQMFYLVKPIEVDKSKKYVVIKVNDEKRYVDTRICQKIPENCKYVTIEHSEYERDWIRLREMQEKRNSEIMNRLIAELLPCVYAKDVACIKRFFPNEDEAFGDGGQYDDLVYKPIVVDDELINELKVCLDYKKILPHMLGSRGIKKVCYFRVPAYTKTHGDKDNTARQLRLISVTPPEAVRVRGNDPIYLLDK